MKVFVFDLDFTIWNAGDTFCSETNPPYLWEGGKLLDRSGRWIRLYPEVKEILQALQNRNKIIATASRTLEPGWARQLLQIFDIVKYFDFLEIYPGDKTAHLSAIQQQTGCSFEEMVFFDDEERNIKDANSLGVKSIMVHHGISFDLIYRYTKI